MKILAIGAHPDDIEIFMFGFLCSCKEMGYKISTVIATDGSLGGNNDDNKLIKNRKKESQNGLNKLGIPLFLDLPDGSLGNESIHTTIIKNAIFFLERVKTCFSNIYDFRSRGKWWLGRTSNTYRDIICNRGCTTSWYQ